MRSPFVALSGHDDTFSSAKELSSSARTALYISPLMLPVYEKLDAEYISVALNSYVVDFLLHGNIDRLVRENSIPGVRGWFMLKSWSLLLKRLYEMLQQTCPIENEQHKQLLFAFQDLQKSFDQQFKSVSSTF